MSDRGDRPPLRLLIDACLTPTVLPILRSRFSIAVDAVHADAILPRAATDATVIDRAAAEHRVVVTANRADFLSLARERPHHAGLVLIRDQNTRERQIADMIRIIVALFEYRETGGEIPGNVFTWRHVQARLAVRKIP